MNKPFHEEARQLANDALDGMSVSKQTLANKLIAAANIVRRLESVVEQKDCTISKLEHELKEGKFGQNEQQSPFGSDLFGDIFGSKRK